MTTKSGAVKNKDLLISMQELHGVLDFIINLYPDRTSSNILEDSALQGAKKSIEDMENELRTSPNFHLNFMIQANFSPLLKPQDELSVALTKALQIVTFFEKWNKYPVKRDADINCIVLEPEALESNALGDIKDEVKKELKLMRFSDQQIERQEKIINFKRRILCDLDGLLNNATVDLNEQEKSILNQCYRALHEARNSNQIILTLKSMKEQLQPYINVPEQKGITHYVSLFIKKIVSLFNKFLHNVDNEQLEPTSKFKETLEQIKGFEKDLDDNQSDRFYH